MPNDHAARPSAMDSASSGFAVEMVRSLCPDSRASGGGRASSRTAALPVPEPTVSAALMASIGLFVGIPDHLRRLSAELDGCSGLIESAQGGAQKG